MKNTLSAYSRGGPPAADGRIEIMRRSRARRTTRTPPVAGPHHLLSRVAILFGDDFALNPHSTVLGDDFEAIGPDGRVAENRGLDAAGQRQIGQPLPVHGGWLQRSAVDDRDDDVHRL